MDPNESRKNKESRDVSSEGIKNPNVDNSASEDKNAQGSQSDLPESSSRRGQDESDESEDENAQNKKSQDELSEQFKKKLNVDDSASEDKNAQGSQSDLPESPNRLGQDESDESEDENAQDNTLQDRSFEVDSVPSSPKDGQSTENIEPLESDTVKLIEEYINNTVPKFVSEGKSQFVILILQPISSIALKHEITDEGLLKNIVPELYKYNRTDTTGTLRNNYKKILETIRKSSHKEDNTLQDSSFVDGSVPSSPKHRQSTGNIEPLESDTVKLIEEYINNTVSKFVSEGKSHRVISILRHIYSIALKRKIIDEGLLRLHRNIVPNFYKYIRIFRDDRTLRNHLNCLLTGMIEPLHEDYWERHFVLFQWNVNGYDDEYKYDMICQYVEKYKQPDVIALQLTLLKTDEPKKNPKNYAIYAKKCVRSGMKTASGGVALLVNKKFEREEVKIPETWKSDYVDICAVKVKLPDIGDVTFYSIYVPAINRCPPSPERKGLSTHQSLVQDVEKLLDEIRSTKERVIISGNFNLNSVTALQNTMKELRSNDVALVLLNDLETMEQSTQPIDLTICSKSFFDPEKSKHHWELMKDTTRLPNHPPWVLMYPKKDIK